MKVAWINPATEADPFYGPMVKMLRIAANDLGVELEVHECRREKAELVESVRKITKRLSKPDYLILINDLNTGRETVPLAAQAGVKVFVICQGFLTGDRSKVDKPRGKHAHWIGELVPDDYRIGADLAEILVTEARRHGKVGSDGKVHVCGLSGTFCAASTLRASGLRKKVVELQDACVDDVFLAGWDQEKAEWWTADLLKRYPQTTVLWAADDEMALGALKAVEAAGLRPGEDVFIGGIDWAPFALPKVREGVFTTSIGGHFMEAAWALVSLFDHHHGKDFSPISAKSEHIAVTSENVNDYLCVLDESRWKNIDFTRFSKVKNPALTRYEFSPSAVLPALR